MPVAVRLVPPVRAGVCRGAGGRRGGRFEQTLRRRGTRLGVGRADLRLGGRTAGVAGTPRPPPPPGRRPHAREHPHPPRPSRPLDGRALDAHGRGPAGTTLAVAGPTGARARVVEQVLRTRRTALSHLDGPLQLGHATLQSPLALVGLHQRVVDADGGPSRARAAQPPGEPFRPDGGADRSGEAPDPRHARRRRTTRRTGASRRWWRARSRPGTAPRAIPARASGPATGSSRPSTAARRRARSTRVIFSMMVSRVQRVTRRPPAVFADGGISELRSASSRSAAC